MVFMGSGREVAPNRLSSAPTLSGQSRATLPEHLESREIGRGFLTANQNGGRERRSDLGCGGSSNFCRRTFGPTERAPHGIHDDVLGPAYHFLRQVAIGQLQRIVANMIEDSVGHFLLGRSCEVGLKFFYPCVPAIR